MSLPPDESEGGGGSTNISAPPELLAMSGSTAVTNRGSEHAERLTRLAARIDEVNRANGWDFSLDDRKELALKVALMASEAAESCEELESGYTDGKGVAEWIDAVQMEMADIAIRILHLLEKLDCDISLNHLVFLGHFRGKRRAALFNLHHFESEVMHELVRPLFQIFEVLRDPAPLPELKNRFEPLLFEVLAECEQISLGLDPSRDLWDIVEKKNEKNSTRGMHHGGKQY